MFTIIKNICILLVTSFLLAGCSKLVEVDPPITSLVSDAVYRHNETSISSVTVNYSQMALSEVNSYLMLSVIPGLGADELTCFSQDRTEEWAYYSNNLSALGAGGGFWLSMYTPYIYRCNVAIHKLSNAVTYEQNSEKSSLNENVRKQLLGEVQFFRAFSYFYLVQLYGDVPLLTTPDYIENSTSGRSSKEKVYQQIIKDLVAAQENLNENYVESDVVTVKPSSPRVRPVRGAATALLARVYLYTGQYAQAEQQALSLINKTNLYSLVALNDIMKANNKEAIWQLQPTMQGQNTPEGWRFILPSTGPEPFMYNIFLNERFMQAFESGDLRKTSWTNSVTAAGTTYHYPYKYKSATANAPVTEYSTVFRLAEQYLICAEARAKRDNISGAQEMLNAIRNRAGLPNTTASTREALEEAILAERRVELFTEMGHRWFDLKRTGKIDAVMTVETPLKGGLGWQSYQQLYPIAYGEIIQNPVLLGQQNPGY